MFKTRLYKEHYPLRTGSQVQCLTERERKQLARWVRGFPIEIMIALRSIAIISDVLSTAMRSVDEGKLMTTKSEVQAMENIAALRGHIAGTKELSSNDTTQIGS